MLDAKTRLMLALSTTMIVSAAMNLDDSAADTTEDGEKNETGRSLLAGTRAPHQKTRREERRQQREQQKMHSNLAARKNAPRR